MRTSSTEVVVVGGGPVGVLAAALLAAEGIDVVLLERRVDEPSGSRAIGVHPPALDVLDRIDAAAPLLGHPRPAPRTRQSARTTPPPGATTTGARTTPSTHATTPAAATTTGAVLVRRGVARSRGRTLGTLSFDGVSRTFPFVATSPQQATETVLRARLEAIAPGTLRRGSTVTAIDQDDDRVQVTAVDGDGQTVRHTARYVVAADGARSSVRDLLGVSTDERPYPDRYVMGDFADPGTAPADTAIVDVGPFGVVESFPLPAGLRRYVVLTPEPDLDAERLAGIVAARTGSGPDPATSSMLSGFGVRRRFVTRMVHGRVVLIGDAAHEISPIGGQGMNLGWLDAGALAPILAQELRPARHAGARTGGATHPRPAPSAAQALASFDATRLRSARIAARQAEWNMAAGRPARGATLTAREMLLRGLTGSPAAALLARVYAMRFA